VRSKCVRRRMWRRSSQCPPTPLMRQDGRKFFVELYSHDFRRNFC